MYFIMANFDNNICISRENHIYYGHQKRISYAHNYISTIYNYTLLKICKYL